MKKRLSVGIASLAVLAMAGSAYAAEAQGKAGNNVLQAQIKSESGIVGGHALIRSSLHGRSTIFWNCCAFAVRLCLRRSARGWACREASQITIDKNSQTFEGTGCYFLLPGAKSFAKLL
ncbi:hypothetical protein [Paenibacillus thiaminolyticus]|uniref:hypothetical protein n=1 Tax=Paenibacillus thiaminolyticus TaxID=49283 RepID=UPI001602AF63|nr:hypothetical protein [Paenibacillus thiaminolyticus]